MTDLWLLIPAATLACLALLAIHWQCYAVSIVLSIMAGAFVAALL